MVLTLIVVLVFMTLGTAILSTAVADTRNVMYQENSMRSYYIARSGAMTLAEKIISDSTINIDNIIDKTADTISIAEGEVSSVHMSKEDDDLIISSIGKFNDVSQQVDVVLRETVGEAFDYTVFSQNEIEVTNGITILGQVATNAQFVDENNPYSAGNNSFPESSDVIYNANIPIPIITMPSFPDEIDYAIETDFTDTVTNDKHVHFQEGINLSNKDTITINGSGVYHMYIEKGMMLSNHSAILVDEDVTIFIYIIDDFDVLIDGSYIEAILIAPNSYVKFHNSSANKIDGRSFHGTIIADSIEIHGNKSEFDQDADSDSESASVKKQYRLLELR